MRRAVLADVAAIKEVLNAAHQSRWVSSLDQPIPRYVLGGDSEVYIGRLGGRAAGCVIAHLGEKTVLSALSVVPELRGQRHAEELIRVAVEDARRLRGHGALVIAYADTRKPRDLERFERVGFVKGGSLGHHTLVVSLPAAIYTPARRPAAHQIPEPTPLRTPGT